MANQTRDPFKNNYNVDDEWSFSDKIGDIESEFDKIKPDKAPKTKARKAINAVGTTATELLKGTSSAVLSELKREIETNMPNTAHVANQAMGFINEFSNIKQDLLKNSASLTQSTKQLFRNLSPKLEKVLPDKLRKQLDKFTKEDETREYKKSQEQVRRDLINESIEKALRIQISQNKTEDDERRLNVAIDRKLEEKRHASNIELLKSIFKENEYHTEFFKTRMTGFMKETLTVQYSQLYVQKDMLSVMQLMSKNFDTKLESIVHNTGLPDYVKTLNSEFFKKSMKERAMQKFSDKASSMITKYSSNLIKSLKNKITGGISGLGSMLDQVNMGLEVSNMAGDMGMEGPSISGELGKMGLNLTSEGIAKYFLGRMSPKTRKKIIDALKKGPETTFNNLSSKLFTKINHARKYKEERPTNPTFWQYLKGTAKDVFLDTFDDIGIDKVENKLAKDPFKATPFDIATRQSIVEIIPRYLSEIHYEIQALRKGEDQATKLTYDERTRDLMSTAMYRKRRQTQMHKDLKQRGAQHYSGGMSAVLVGNIHHATNEKEKENYKLDVKNYQNDVESIMTNMAAGNESLEPDLIRKYAYDYDLKTNEQKYIHNVFKDIKNPKAVAKLLSRSFFTPDGKQNKDVIEQFEGNLFGLMQSDSLKDVLSEMQDSGKQYLFKDYFNDQDEFASGDQEFNFKNALNIGARDYSQSKYNRYLAQSYGQLFTILKDQGISTNEIVDKLPKSMQGFIRSKVPSRFFDKRFGARKQFNTFDDFIDGETYLGNKKADRKALINFLGLTKSNVRKRTLGNALSKSSVAAPYFEPFNGSGSGESVGQLGQVEVTATRGEHILLDPINSIIDILKDCLCNKTNKVSTDVETERFNTLINTIVPLQQGLTTIGQQLILLRQENQMLAVAQMDANRVMAGGKPQPQKIRGLWGAIGQMGAATISGIGNVAAASTKGAWGAAKLGIKAAGAIIPALAIGSGRAIGGIAKGAGIGVSGLVRSNVAMISALGRGAVNIGKGIGWLFGRRGKNTNNGIGSEIADENSIQDVYVIGKKDVAIRKDQFREGVYTRDPEGKLQLVKSVKDIKGPVYDSEGTELINEEQIQNGLFDFTGRRFGNIKAYTQGDKNKKSGLLGKLGGLAGKGILGAGKWLGKSALLMPGTPGNLMMKMGLGAVGFAGKTVGRLAGKLFGFDKNRSESEITLKDLHALVTTRLDTMIKLMEEGSFGGKKKVFGDQDNDGDREGSYEDYVQKRLLEKQMRQNKKTDEKKVNAKEKDDKEGGLFSTLFSLIPGGGLLKKLFKRTSKKIGIKLLRFLTKFKGAKSILSILGLLLGVPMLGALGGKLKDMLFGGMKDKALDVAGDAAMKTAGKAALKKGATALAVGGAGKLATSAIAKSASHFAAPTTAKVAATAGGAAAGAITNAAKQDTGIITKCLLWLKDKLPSSWGKHIDKIIKGLSRILKKLSSTALIKILGRLAAGPIGWIVWAGDMVYEAGKAIWNPQESLGVAESISIDWGDRFIIGVAAAIAESVFLGLIPTTFIADILGVDVSKYVKEHEEELDKKESDLDNMMKTEQKQQQQNQTQHQQTITQSQSTYQNQNSNLELQRHHAEVKKSEESFLNRAWGKVTSFFNSGAGAGVMNPTSVGSGGGTPDASIPGGGLATIHYQPGSLNTGISANGGASGNVDLSQFDNVKPANVTGGGDKIGDYVAKWESTTKGSKMIAFDKNGGTSYGKYQIASRGKHNTFPDFIKMIANSKSPNAKMVADAMSKIKNWDTGNKDPNTEPAKLWLTLANKGLIQEFEHEFILRRYNSVLRNLPPDLREAIQNSRGLQEMLWSTVVQHGPGGPNSSAGATPIFKKCWKKGMPLDQFVKAVYADRKGRVKNYDMGPRYREECACILGLLNKEGVKPGQPSGNAQPGNLDTGAAAGNMQQSPNSSASGQQMSQSQSGGGSSGSLGGGTVGGETGGQSPSMSNPSGSGGGFDDGKGSTPDASTGSQYGGDSSGWESIYKPGSFKLNNDNQNKDVKDLGVGAPKDVQEAVKIMKDLGTKVNEITSGGGGWTSVARVNPELVKRMAMAMQAFYKQTGKKIALTSAARDEADQKRLIASGTPGVARNPSRSPHVRKKAFDIKGNNGEQVKGKGFNTGTIADRFETVARQFGVYRPYRKKNEEQHFELMKNPPDMQAPEAKGMEVSDKELQQTPNGKGAIPGADAAKASGASQEQVQQAAQMDASGGPGPDATQQTSTGSTNGTDMSSIPSGGGAGSATAANMATDASSSGVSTPGMDTSTPTGNMTVDFAPLIDVLKQANIYLEAITKNTNGISDITSKAANAVNQVGNMNEKPPVKRDFNAQSNAPVSQYGDASGWDTYKPGSFKLNKESVPVLDTSRQVATNSHFL